MIYDDKIHIMQDFEMLGPGDTAKVIGAGAAVFGIEAWAGEHGADDVVWRPFARLVYEAWPINVKGQDARTSTWDTVAWWSRQDPEVRDVAFQAMDDGRRGCRPGTPLRLAVKELVDAATSAAWSPALLGPDAWKRIVWWAKPSAADGALWMSLLREFRPDLSMLYGRVRDAGTLLDACELATGRRPEERRDPSGKLHDPGSDALAQAWACAEAMALLAEVRDRNR